MSEQVNLASEQAMQEQQNIDNTNLGPNKSFQRESQSSRNGKGARCRNLFIAAVALVSIILLSVYPHKGTNFSCNLHPQYEEYIFKSFESFNTGITEAMINKTKDSIFLRKIKVKDGQFSFEATGGDPIQIWMDFLKECAEILPDSEFLISVIDAPRVPKNKWIKNKDWPKYACDQNYEIPWQHSFFKKACRFEPIAQKVPIFSFGVIPQCFTDIIFPSHFHFPVKKISKSVDWKEKSFVAFWRGTLTGIPIEYDNCDCKEVSWDSCKYDISEFHRPKLVNLCKNISDCDAGFTSFLKEDCKYNSTGRLRSIFQTVNFTSMEEQTKFKLIIDIDGFTYSLRFPELLSSGSAILKIHSFKDIGSILAKPWVHYIPVKMDLSDLEEKIRWAKENDDDVRRIARQGVELSKVYTEEQYKCYVFKLISLYVKLFVSEEQYEANERRRRAQEEKDQEISEMCHLDAGFERQIAADITPFRLGISPSMVETAKEQAGVYIVKIHNHTAKVSGVEMSEEQRSFFQDVAKYLPDMEFVVNSGTQPRVLKYNNLKGGMKEELLCDRGFEKPKHGLFTQPCSWSPVNDLIPIFGPSKVPECFIDILLPTGMALHNQAKVRWKDKQFGSVWRGASEGGNFGGWQCLKKQKEMEEAPFQDFLRQRLVQLCSIVKDCDAKFTEYSQCSNPTCSKMRTKYGKQVEKQAIKDQARHKIIIDIDGNGYSKEFVEKLSSGSAVLKISAFLDFSLIIAQPWVHFVPVRVDLEDLAKQLQWARDNDEELQKIALRAKELTRKQLDYFSQKCYAIRVLREYSRLLIPEDRYKARLKIKQANPQYQP